MNANRMIGVLALAAATVGVCGAVRAQPDTAPRNAIAVPPKESEVTSTGSAKVERKPDFVEIAVGVTMIDKSASEAQAAAEKTMAAAIKAIGALSLADSDLKSGSVTLSPRYEQRNYAADTGPKIIGYEASMSTRVKTTDLKSVSKVIDAALAAGCNRIDRVEFGVKEALAAREEALAMATKAAMRKVKVMAEALDLATTRVVRISSSQGSTGAWPRMSNLANSVSMRESGGGQDESVVPGTIEIWAEVELTCAAQSASR